MQRLYIYVSLVMVVFTATNCANISAPKGGPKDTTPPKMIKDKTTPNLQTNFTKQPIEFTFDEWVKLYDAFNQVVVSPPLEFKPKISLKKRTVIFEFDEKEELRKDATYTINFGEAVKDLTEGNIVPDMRFVFSTGDFIDSLKVSGVARDAFNNEPVKDAFVLLYENLNDSVFIKNRPFYFGRTDDKGSFQINNVKSGKFKVCALVESLVDYKYNNETERIGFLDEPIVLSGNNVTGLSIKIFDERQNIRITSKDIKTYGLVKLGFNEDAKDVNITFEDIGQKVQIEHQKDTIKLWYQPVQDSSWNVYVKLDTILDDTIKVKPVSKEKFLKTAKLFPEPKFEKGNKSINPFQQIELVFNRPITKVDTSKIQLLEDSVKTKVMPLINLDSTDKQKIIINHKWLEEKPYELFLKPGAITDYLGIENDTLEQNYLVLAKNSLATINLTLSELDPENNYVLQLFTKSDKLVDEQLISNDSIYKKVYSDMEVGEYKFHVITDLNKNGKWDPGNYEEKKQAEQINIKPIEKLRANWEVEVQMQATPQILAAPTTPSFIQDSIPKNEGRRGKPKGLKKD